MNIYDFDGTIYDGDSSVDFFKYCKKKNRKCLLILPGFLIAMFLYYIKIYEKEELKSAFFRFVKYFDNIDQVVIDFWASKDYLLKDFYVKQNNKNDIVISASPYFLLEPLAKKYNFRLIATMVNKKTGKLESKNCYKLEKVIKLKELKIDHCDNFYSDSLVDTPCANLAKNAFIVKKNQIVQWNDYHENLLKKIKSFLFNRDFVLFVLIGCINAFNGIFISYGYSFFIKNAIIAYILGFITSLCISYILNSLLNFKEKLSWPKFIKYCINNIPNFIIQVFSVVVLINLLHFNKLLSYSVSAVIAVPITFILLISNVFNKNKSTGKV